jgi:uncharacterized membrane protein SpoIIM required for sporulation
VSEPGVQLAAARSGEEPWSVAFRRGREPSWRELNRLLGVVERKGVRALDAADLARLPVLYRAALSSLSVARAVSLDRNLLEYLEVLAARAYLAVYGPKRSFVAVALSFLGRELPAAVRAAAPQVAVAAAAMLLGHVVAQVLVAGDMDLFWHFVPADMAGGRDPLASTADLRASLFHGAGNVDQLSVFAAFLFSHNAQIAMLCFGLGFVAGVPVLLLLFFNGMILGGMSALYHDRGLALEWWSWVLPHGITEMLAVVLAGAAGLVLADAMILPGRTARVHRLAERGRLAGTIVLGTVGMLFLAGLIEGEFRQLVQDVTVRFLLAATTAVFWLWYYAFAGRKRRP